MASLSKREQARNERDLQDLLQRPGNSQCADCSARNPGWASWSLGIFLCVRCASIHRKLGTHISKVKSLSMDKWTSEQVEMMKQQGNIASNKIYNPKNKKPDMPIDADEVDSAMERYIRKKYQEKSLVDGRPEPPSRADLSPTMAQSPQLSSNSDMPVAGKKHKFFGFSLRTSSKKDRPGIENTFKVTPVEYSPTTGSVREIPDREMQEKLAQLNDMGFPDNERNLNILKRSGGDLERTIATLVKLGPSEPQRRASPTPPRVATASTFPSENAAPSRSNNPFDQLDDPKPQSDGGFGLSLGGAAPQALQQQQQQPQSSQYQAPNSNPWQNAMAPPTSAGLDQQFSTLQVSNPLFPHHTGGYVGASSYQDPRLHTMTPPVSNYQQQYGYPASPSSATSNLFYQPPQPLSSQSTGSNPFLQQQQNLPVFAPNTSGNPFYATQQHQSQTTAFGSSNPFGLSAQSQQFHTGQQYAQSPQPLPQSTNPFGLSPQASPPPIQQAQPFSVPPQPQFPGFQYGHPQAQPQSQSYDAYQQNSQIQFQPQQQQALQAQTTGRYTKNDIMALFSQPSTFQQPGLPPVQEASDDPSQQAVPQPQQTLSPTPSNNPYGAVSPSASKRAATMPVSSMSTMHSSGGIGSRNPFMSAQSSTSTLSPAAVPFGQGQQQLQPAQSYAPQGWQGSVRHASNESVSVNNPSLMDGRHSPDAFANLSSRY